MAAEYVSDEDDCAVRPVDLGVGAPLRIKEFSLLEDEAGAVVWDAGLVLAHYLAHRHRKGCCIVSGRTVLELGSGTGAVGLAAGRLGAAAVTLSDLPHLVPYLRENIQANMLGTTVSAVPLQWGNAEHLATAKCGVLLRPPHVVLASDVVYTPETRASLFATLDAVMAPPRRRKQQPQHHTQQQEQGIEPGGEGQELSPHGQQDEQQQVGQEEAHQGKGEQNSESRERQGAEDNGQQGHHEQGPAATQQSVDASSRGDAAEPSGSGGGGGPAGVQDDEWLHALVGGTVAVLAFEDRPGVEEVPGLCERHGLHCVEVPEEELHPDWRCPEIHVLLLQKMDT